MPSRGVARRSVAVGARNADEMHEALSGTFMHHGSRGASERRLASLASKRSQVRGARDAFAGDHSADRLWVPVEPPDVLCRAHPPGRTDAAARSKRFPVSMKPGRKTTHSSKSVRAARLSGFGPLPAPVIRPGVGGAGLISGACAYRASKPRATSCAARFTPGATEEEWCERHLLARIHRYTVRRFAARKIEPVELQDFMRFLFRLGNTSAQIPKPTRTATATTRLMQAIEQLQGYEGRPPSHGKTRSCPHA